VGGGDASDEFRYHARKQPESLLNAMHSPLQGEQPTVQIYWTNTFTGSERLCGATCGRHR